MYKPREGNCVAGDGPIETLPLGVECAIDMSITPPTIVAVYLYHPKPHDNVNDKLVNTDQTCESRLVLKRNGLLDIYQKIEFVNVDTVDVEAFLALLKDTYKLKKEVKDKIVNIKLYLQHLRNKLCIPEVNNFTRLIAQQTIRKNGKVDEINNLKKWRDVLSKIGGSRHSPIIEPIDDSIDFQYCLIISYPGIVIPRISFDMFYNVHKHGAWFLNEIIDILELQETEKDITEALAFMKKRITEIKRIYKRATGISILAKKLPWFYKMLKQAGPGLHSEKDQIEIIKSLETMRKKIHGHS
jgi:hypothetical protein